MRWNAGLDAEGNRGLFRRHTVIQFQPSREALRAVRPTQAHARPVSTAHPAIDARRAVFRLAEVIELHGVRRSKRGGGQCFAFEATQHEVRIGVR